MELLPETQLVVGTVTLEAEKDEQTQRLVAGQTA
jgi:hypothetical protein